MNNSVYLFEKPKNEPVYSYAPGTPEREALKAALDRQATQEVEIPIIIGGKEYRTGARLESPAMDGESLHYDAYCTPYRHKVSLRT